MWVKRKLIDHLIKHDAELSLKLNELEDKIFELRIYTENIDNRLSKQETTKFNVKTDKKQA